MKNLKLNTDYQKIFDNIMKEGIIWLEDNPYIKSFIIGVSGGIDSSLVLLLMKQLQIKAEIKLGRSFKIIGRSLPINGNKIDEINRAEKMEHFCDNFQTINLDMLFYDIMTIIEPELKGAYLTDNDKIRQGNFKARTRMMYLYNLASKNNGVVMSTDNLTEIYMGFWTLHGSVGDLGFVQELWKTEIFGLYEWIINKYNKYDKFLFDVLYAVPTDGLGISNSDIDQLIPNWKELFDENDKTIWQQTYKFIDETMIEFFNANGFVLKTDSHTKAKKNIIKQYINTKFKRNNPFGFDRNKLVN